MDGVRANTPDVVTALASGDMVANPRPAVAFFFAGVGVPASLGEEMGEVWGRYSPRAALMASRSRS